MRRPQQGFSTIAASVILACIAGVAAWRYAGYSPSSTAAAEAGVTSSAPAAPARSPYPPPPAPAGAAVASIHDGKGAIAVWIFKDLVHGARYTPAAGWVEAGPLEEIAGTASDLQLAGNGKGDAMAVWRHTVGSIHSLRFSRFESDTGWSVAGVVPGMLPRGVASGPTPVLQVDPIGNANLQWPSGFSDVAMQSTRFIEARGWSEPQDLRQSAQGAGAAKR